MDDITFTHEKKIALVTVCYKDEEAIRSRATLLDDDSQFDETIISHEMLIRTHLEEEN